MPCQIALTSSAESRLLGVWDIPSDLRASSAGTGHADFLGKNQKQLGPYLYSPGHLSVETMRELYLARS